VARSNCPGAMADVCVIGGGPAGATCARVLAALGLDTLLLYRLDRPQPVADILPPEAAAAVDKLGLRRLLEKDERCAAPCTGLWSNLNAASAPTFRSFRSRPEDRNGWIVDRARLDGALRDLAAASGADCRIGRLRRAVRERSGVWHVTGDDGGSVWIARARFLVDASGRPGALARHHGARHVCLDKRVAVAAYWPPAPERHRDDGVAVIERAARGWWYAARLPDGALHVAHHVAAQERARPPAARGCWTHEKPGPMVEARQQRHANGRAPERVVCRAAGMARNEPMAGRDWVAVGDAAAAFDPVSGQGLANALVSGAIAARAIADHFAGRIAALPAFAEAMAATHRHAAMHTHDLYCSLQ